MKFSDTRYANIYEEFYNNENQHNKIDIAYKKLETLEGIPEVINGSLNCSYNRIKSLEYRPKEIKGDFDCSNNDLSSLEYSPNVKKNYDCSSNVLISLKGIQKKINGNYNCSSNLLKSLKGSPEIINGYYDCSSNELESLKYRPKKIKGNFKCKNNPELKNVKQEIIENQIKAKSYSTDEGNFYFEEIEIEFKKYSDMLLKIEEQKENKLKEKLNIKNNKKIINKNDFGLSI